MIYPLVDERGALRAMLPFEVVWSDGVMAGHGYMDTGSPHVTIPATFLPAAVDWDGLPRGGTTPTLRGPVEYRKWTAVVSVEGVAITSTIKVTAGEWLPAPILGTELLQQFRVELDWRANLFSIRPYDLVAVPLAIDALPILEDGDRLITIPASTGRPKVERLTAGAVAAPIPQLEPSTSRPAAPEPPETPPTRRERRQLARAASRAR